MRSGALGILLLALGVAMAAWLWGRGSSFTGYSSEKLDTLERGYGEVSALKPAVPLTAPSKPTQRSLERVRATAEEAAVSLSLLQDERRRRGILASALAVAAVAAAGLLLLQLQHRSRRPRMVEEARLVAALGTPESLLASEQARAAGLLGVAPDASPQVVEAALLAQLSAYEPAKLVGLAPQLQEAAEGQRHALLRARDCLLGARVRTGVPHERSGPNPAR
jgi:DnaJ-domain-containing protein 1